MLHRLRDQMHTWRPLPRTLSLAALFFASVLLVSGCGKFFVPQTNPNPPTPGSGGPALYIANGDTGTVSAIGVTSSGLSALSGSPYALGVSPTAMAITPSNSFLYVASAGGG